MTRQTAARKFRASLSYRVAIRWKSLMRPNIRSLALRPQQRTGEKQFFLRRLTFGGMLGPPPCPRSCGGRYCCHSPCPQAGSRLLACAPTGYLWPCSQPPSRRSAGKPGVGIRYPSGHGSWSCARRGNGRLPACAPPFSTGGAAMRLDRRAVDQHLGRRPARRRQSMEDIRPYVLGDPAQKAIIERLLRTVGRQRV